MKYSFVEWYAQWNVRACSCKLRKNNVNIKSTSEPSIFPTRILHPRVYLHDARLNLWPWTTADFNAPVPIKLPCQWGAYIVVGIHGPRLDDRLLASSPTGNEKNSMKVSALINHDKYNQAGYYQDQKRTYTSHIHKTHSSYHLSRKVTHTRGVGIKVPW